MSETKTRSTNKQKEQEKALGKRAFRLREQLEREGDEELFDFLKKGDNIGEKEVQE